MSKTEYAVEVYDKNDSFDRQLEVFNTVEEANAFKENYDEPLDNGEYLGILAINYDDDGKELNTERH